MLRELPAGRRPVETHVVDGARARARAYERIREEIAAGRQCFVVCPLVEESEALQAKAATVEFERLTDGEFRDQRVALIHGQMQTAEKAGGDALVRRGRGRRARGHERDRGGHRRAQRDRDADRGGRPLRALTAPPAARTSRARGARQSVCILFGEPKLPRLQAIASERDGFRLAEVDLELRGAGEVLGTRQSGLPEFRVARLPEDQDLLERARARADELIERDPGLGEPEHALLRGAVIDRFGSDLDPIPA